jgi:hypothetical protein
VIALGVMRSLIHAACCDRQAYASVALFCIDVLAVVSASGLVNSRRASESHAYEDVFACAPSDYNAVLFSPKCARM